MQLVVLAVPSKNIRYALNDQQWKACLESWTELLSVALRLSDDEFRDAIDPSVPVFLHSYVHERNLELSDELSDDSRRLAVAVPLARNVLLIVSRLFTNRCAPESMINIQFLADFTTIYSKRNRSATRQAIDAVLESHSSTIEDETSDLDIQFRISSILDLTMSSSYGTYLMRTRYAQAINRAYSIDRRKQNEFWKLAFLLATHEDATLKFLDALFNVNGEIGQLGHDLLASPAFVVQLQDSTRNRPELASLVERLMSQYQQERFASDSTLNATEGEELDGGFDYSQSETAELLSKISQIRDLFPDLGEGFVEACLRAYDMDTEATTMHLLEDDLPPHLQELDRAESRAPTPMMTHQPRRDVPDVLEAPSIARLNIYDKDDFDRLQFTKDQVYQGRRMSTSADSLLKKQVSTDIKQKVLSLAYDPNDDELDDTYEQFEGAAIVDIQNNDELGEASKADVPSFDNLLFATFETDPGVFDRGARKAPARQDLRARTNLSDEQIEGWKAMLDREPSRLKRLIKDNAFAGNQKDLESTWWSATESGISASDRGRGGRIRGAGGRGRGKAVDGAVSSKTSEQIRRERAKKDVRGSGRDRGRGSGMRGQARPPG